MESYYNIYQQRIRELGQQSKEKTKGLSEDDLEKMNELFRTHLLEKIFKEKRKEILEMVKNSDGEIPIILDDYQREAIERILNDKDWDIDNSIEDILNELSKESKKISSLQKKAIREILKSEGDRAMSIYLLELLKDLSSKEKTLDIIDRLAGEEGVDINDEDYTDEDEDEEEDFLK